MVCVRFAVVFLSTPVPRSIQIDIPSLETFCKV